jgi:hypothetical protein
MFDYYTIFSIICWILGLIGIALFIAGSTIKEKDSSDTTPVSNSTNKIQVI